MVWFAQAHEPCRKLLVLQFPLRLQVLQFIAFPFVNRLLDVRLNPVDFTKAKANIIEQLPELLLTNPLGIVVLLVLRFQALPMPLRRKATVTGPGFQ